MRASSRWILLPALCASFFLSTAALAALAVLEVEDHANLFSPEARTKANKLIKEIKDDFKKDLLIETYDTIPADRMEAYDKAKDDDAARGKFFQEWALSRAKAREVQGVYLLILAPKDPKVRGRIQEEVGNETKKKVFTQADGRRLYEIVVAKFAAATKTKDEAEQKKLHDQGLIEGVEFVGRTMKANLGGKGSVGAVPLEGGKQRGESGGSAPAWVASLPGLLCTLLVVGLIIWVVIGLIRAFTGASRGGYGAGGAQGMAGGPGYGGGGGGGGGGFMTGMLGGLFGAAAGSFLYDRFFRGDYGGGSAGGMGGSQAYGADPQTGAGPSDTDYSGGGGDFGGDAGGGGGGDFGGDAGGGGGDFGGGGGDFGGGGGDFGGGGGDFGGGGGDF